MEGWLGKGLWASEAAEGFSEGVAKGSSEGVFENFGSSGLSIYRVKSR